MFAYIVGRVDELAGDRAVIEAHGVGYELLCSSATLRTLLPGETAKLCTHFHLTQDGVFLFGFYDADERAMFKKLISVTRVGPKVAIAVLSHLSVSDIANAVLTENAAAFDKVPGMGKKTAARLLLELKEQMSGIGTGSKTAGVEFAAESLSMRQEAIEALISLGYDGVSAGRAVAQIPDCERVEDMIQKALKSMVKG